MSRTMSNYYFTVEAIPEYVSAAATDPCEVTITGVDLDGTTSVLFSLDPPDDPVTVLAEDFTTHTSTSIVIDEAALGGKTIFDISLFYGDAVYADNAFHGGPEGDGLELAVVDCP